MKAINRIILYFHYLRRPGSVALLFAAMAVSVGCSKTEEPTDTNARPSKPLAAQGSDVAVVTFPATYRSFATDPDGDNVTLYFYWGDGDSSVVSLAATDTIGAATHTYTKTASFRIFVVATDTKGLRSDSSDGLRVTVVEPGPVPPTRPVGEDTVFVDTFFTFTSTSSSPNADSLQMRFFWGDGSATTTPWDTNNAIFSAVHIWSDTGDFIVRADAVDNLDSVSNKSLGKFITVINRSPLAPAMPIWDSIVTPWADSAQTFKTATRDPEGDDVSMTFLWGDGFTGQSSLQPHLDTFVDAHTYLDTGRYTVRAFAIDIHGHVSDTSAPLSIHLPYFPADTVKVFTEGVDKNFLQIRESWRIVFMNFDSLGAGVVHTFKVDSVFETKFLKLGELDVVAADSVGTFNFYCADHPSRLTERGSLIVLSRGGRPGRR